MSWDNTTVRWTKEETSTLEANLYSTDYDKLEELLPGRSINSIKAKQKRLQKADPIPRNLVPTMFNYYLQGEAEGQILKRMMDAGLGPYTLRDIGLALKKARTESERIYAEEHNHKPTLDQLRDFIKERNGKAMD